MQRTRMSTTPCRDVPIGMPCERKVLEPFHASGKCMNDSGNQQITARQQQLSLDRMHRSKQSDYNKISKSYEAQSEDTYLGCSGRAAASRQSFDWTVSWLD